MIESSGNKQRLSRESLNSYSVSAALFFQVPPATVLYPVVVRASLF